MALDKLDDDCLLEVLDRLLLDQLFKMLGVNHRVNRLTARKIRDKVKAIGFSESNKLCAHHCSNDSQVLVLNKMLKNVNQELREASLKTLFLNLLTLCGGVKSIEFGCFKFTSDVLSEVVRNCSDVECIKLSTSIVKADDWDWFMDQVGHKIIHFEASCDRNKDTPQSEAQETSVKLLQAVASKCNNIRQVSWSTPWGLTWHLVMALQQLPSTCWIKFTCDHLNHLDEDLAKDLFEVTDELNIYSIDWSLFGDRNDRLSSLTLCKLTPFDAQVCGVEFTKLKKLAITLNLHLTDFSSSPKFADFVIASQFPLLEEFWLKALGLTEDGYQAMFGRMTSLKKLTIVIDMDYMINPGYPQLPKLAILQLNKLETIIIKIVMVEINWKLEDFIQHLEEYVSTISSLKKLTIDLSGLFIKDVKSKIVNGVRQLKSVQSIDKLELFE